MSKYVVELNELPKNCFECPLIKYDNFPSGWNWCSITGEIVYDDCRQCKCPIKIVEN